MKYIDLKLVREQLDNRLGSLKELAASGMPRQGWIRTIREALGMSSTYLGKKAKLGQPRISRLESAEMTGDLKVSSLQKIAKALGMTFVYGFVPESTMEEMVRKRAEKIVSQRMARLDRTMRLEQQGLSDKDKKKAFQGMVEKLLIENPKDLWRADDEPFMI